MVVLEVINSLSNRAGAEVFFSQLNKYLNRDKNITLFVVSLFDGVDISILNMFKENNITFLTLGKKKGLDFSCANRFRKIVKEINPDIINTHLDTLILYFIAFGFKKRPWKILHTVHSVVDKESNKITNILRKIYISKDIFEFIGISDLITSSIKFKFPNAVVSTIYNGIEMPLFNQCLNTKYDFICVARFCKVKNHKLLIDAFDLFHSKYPDANLALVGDGVLKEEIIEYAKSLKCYPDVCFLGSCNNVFDYLRSSRIFVLSSFYEGNPISILEAISCGLPVVAPRVGGIPDVIEEKSNGLLFEVNNCFELENCLEYFYNLSNDDFDSFRKNNLIKSEKFNIKNTAEEYIKVFEKAIKNGKK